MAKVGRPSSSYKVANPGERWCNYKEHFAPVIFFKGNDNYCKDCRKIYNRKSYLQKKKDKPTAVVISKEIEALCTCGALLTFNESGSWTCPDCGKDWTAVIKARIESE